MATRTEAVRLVLQDDFSSGMAKAAAAAMLFDKTLSGLDGKRVKAELDPAGESIKKVGAGSNKAGPEIDRLSGRLRLLTDAAVTLGPALVPLGAATIPVLTGALAGLAATGGGITAAVLAFNGLGDALGSIQDYRLEPTADNLQAMRLEMEKMGPAGANFSRFLANLEPGLRDLQNVARAGIFPGLEEGIEALATRGPQVTGIIAKISTSLGELATEAGEALGGDEWTAFFDYLDNEAAPTLEAFAHSIGNLSLGLANMLVAFSPVTNDFTGGLESMTKAFADWTSTLGSNQSFQEFVQYIRESGPQAVEFLGAIAQAISGLLQAAAPLGAIVLPALTGIAKAFGAIASSDVGPALYAAAAGLVAFNRAAALSTKYGPRLTTTFEGLSRARLAGSAAAGIGLVALSMTDLDEKVGLANTSMNAMAGLMIGGPWGLAIGGGIGYAQDFAAANDALDASLDALDFAAASGDVALYSAALENAKAALDNMKPDPAVTDALLGFGVVGMLTNKDNFAKLWAEISGANSDAAEKIREAEDAFNGVGASAYDAAGMERLLFGATQDLGNAFGNAVSGAEQFSGALATLNGWFDKRDAVRAYKDSIDTLRESLKDGFSREDAANIDAIGRSILQVAEGIKDPGRRADFLAGARQSLLDIAQNGGPKVKAAVAEIIDKFRELGLMNAEPKITADDRRAKQAAGNIKTEWGYLDKLTSQPKIQANTGNSIPLLTQVRNLISSINSKSVTITVNRRGGSTSDLGGRSVPAPSADGSTVPKSGRGYADRYHYLLADGEEVISNRYGQADRHRSLLKAINNNQRLAAGGTTGGSTYVTRDPNAGVYADAASALGVFVAETVGAGRSLKALNASLSKQEKALDRANAALESLTSQRDSLASSTGSAYGKADLFGGGLSLFDAALGANTSDTLAAQAALMAASSNGLDGALLQALATSGDLTLLQQFAGLSPEAIALREQQFGTYSSAQSSLGQTAADLSGLTAAVKEQKASNNELRQEVKHLRAELNAFSDKASDKIADKAGAGVFQATKDAQDGKTQRTGNFQATGAKRLGR